MMTMAGTAPVQHFELKRHLHGLKGQPVALVYRSGAGTIVVHFGRLFPRFSGRRVYRPFGEYSMTLTNTEWELNRFGKGLAYHFSRTGEIERALNRLEGSKVAGLEFGDGTCTVRFGNGYELIATEAGNAFGGSAHASSWVLFCKREALLCHPDIPELYDDEPG